MGEVETGGRSVSVDDESYPSLPVAGKVGNVAGKGDGPYGRDERTGVSRKSDNDEDWRVRTIPGTNLENNGDCVV